MRGGKSFLILLGVALALGGYIYFVELKSDPSGTPEKKDKVFAIESGKIEELEIRAASGETTALKKQGDNWQIVAPAGLDLDPSEVSGVVSTLETLESQRTLEENPSSVAEFGLEPARLAVGFRAAGDSAMRRLLLGKKTPTGGDIYARVEGQPKVFLISAYLEDSLNKTPFNLRDKTVLKIDRVGVDMLGLESQGAPALTFQRKDSEWRFTKPIDARADFSAVDNIVGKVAQAKMKAIEPPPAGKEFTPADLKKFGLDKPQATATLGVGSTRATLALGGKKDDTTIYARDVTRPVVFTVESSLLEDFKHKAADLRKKDVFDFRSFTAVGLDLTMGKDSATFAKVKEEPEKPKDEKGKEKEKEKDKAKADDPPPAPVDKWKLTKPSTKDVDQSKVTDLLTTISNLRADTFADKAATGGEELVVVARFGDPAKPQTERVIFRKSGGTVHAIVAGEPGAAVVSTSDFDKAVALFKELAGTK
jgi:hypothetical protein